MNEDPQPSSGVSRRGFLKTAGLAAGGVLLAGCDHEDPFALAKPDVPGAQRWRLGEERFINSICGQCQAGCGIRVRVVEGRAVKIEGNPRHPLNRGGLGPKGQAGLGLLYHPDRIRGPMRREGPRGAGQWKAISWDEAIKSVAQELRALRDGGAPEGLVVLDGLARGMGREFWERFLSAYGSPNHVDHRSTTDGGQLLAMTYMHGVSEIPAYDWERTRYVLGFGVSLFESWCQNIHLTRASSHMRRGRPGQRVKFVQVSPRFSVTAAKADEWVPIRPATYGALALGLGHVLVRDGLFDQDFVQQRCFGFEDWEDAEGRKRRGFRDLLLKDYPPEKVAEITGVPVAVITRLAHELAEHRPGVSLADGQTAAATNGLGTAMAIHALNALVGNLERPGGLLVQRPAPLQPWAEVVPDEQARKGRAAPRLDGFGGPRHPLGRGSVLVLPEALLSGEPYAAQALFFYYANPIFSKPDGRRWREAIQKVPLVVSFSPLMDESARWADILLPESTYFERWEVVEPVPSLGYPVLGFRQPVVEPLHDTREAADVLIQLAREIGPGVAEAFPWKSGRAAILERLEGLLKVETGSTVATKMPALGKGLQSDGGWWSEGYPFEKGETACATPSGKFEFFSQAIDARLKTAFPDEGRLEAIGVQTRGDDLRLPHWEPPRFVGDERAFPFILVAYRGIEYAEGGARHLPRLRELPLGGRMAWAERCELNPADARRLELEEGQEASLETEAGRLELRVKLNEGMRPGTIGLALGHGAWPPSAEPASGYGLLASACDPLTGHLASQGTRARIRKAGEP